eukprot:729476-Pyramimonas_sp.AAC.1
MEILGEAGGGEHMARKLENLGELSGAVGALKGSVENAPPMGGSVSEATKATVTIDRYTAAPGLEGPPAEK